LTANPGQASSPALSPDDTLPVEKRLLAFTGRDEGHSEVYVMPAEGGPSRRLTFLGADSQVAGWTPEGKIVFASNAGQPFVRLYLLYAIAPEGGEPQLLPTGPALNATFEPGGPGVVIARNTTDIAQWKRYRGGRTGDLWVDRNGIGNWERLIRLGGNVARPMWVGERIYFVSDHEGVGNLYSCLPDGSDVQRHTWHTDYYARMPSTDGRRIVYVAGADLFLYDPATSVSERIAVAFHSPQVQRKRRFVETDRYFQSYAVHPEGHSIALTVRGRAFSMGNWEGPVQQHGDPNGARYRLAEWLRDGQRLVMISDVTGEETLEVHGADPSVPIERLEGLDIGRPVSLTVNPCRDEVALTNHRYELIVVNLADKTMRLIERSRYERLRGVAYSPDGRWLAYGFPDTSQTTRIKLCLLETGEIWPVTQPVLHDIGPAFSPDGKYLYLLSYRDFDPVYDNLQFDLNFPWGMRPYLLTLRADLPSPFTPTPRAPGKKAGAGKPPEPESDSEADNNPEGEKTDDQSSDARGVPQVEIDLEGIADRILAFPVSEDRYGRIVGIKGKVLFSSYPVEGALKPPNGGNGNAGKGLIEVYDFDELKHEVLIRGISSFELSLDGSTLAYRSGNKLRVIEAGSKPNGDDTTPGRKTGWVDLSRVKVDLDPPAEWEQMYRQAWRLQRDQFWSEDMSGVDWHAVYTRYLPLVQRVATRAEFSDLIWEMQGELGTSHAYEIGGDYRPEPHYRQGFLGASLRYDADSDSYVVVSIARGDPWDEEASSPLARAGVQVKPGDRLVAVNGRRVNGSLAPWELLVNQAGSEVRLGFLAADAAPDARPRFVTVKALQDETASHYREWVEANRRKVHAATGGRVGYVHIPDMGARGYAEFHRGYLAEVSREGLIVDVRYNRGGHVSSLLLEKLARKRLGYDVSRWGEPAPYPPESVHGPIVALTNEHAGSDGDIFSHAFKLMGLGPLIGTRTWGGVIGIWPREPLADGTVTTQPEFSFWFEDIGWGIENYGTDPDIEVEIRPQDYTAGHDPQLGRAIDEIQKALAEHPPVLPDFGGRPKLAVPGVVTPRDDESGNRT
jgi:tricorn protease